MKRSIKFVWGSSRVIRGRWYLGLFGLYDRTGKSNDGLAISLRGLAGWGCGLGLVTYVAGAAALFSIWERNPHSLLTFTDALLYPVRREEIAQKKGRALSAQGIDLFRAKKYHEAANLLRLGLARCPHDFGARLKLAQYYELINRRPAALQVLTKGLGGDFPPRQYLQALFNAAEQGENFDLIVGVGHRYLPRLRAAGSRFDRHWLLGRQLTALLAAGRPAAALALAEAEEAGERINEYRVLALLALGRAGDAIAFLADWRARPGVDLNTVIRFNVRALQEAGRFDAMDRAIAELRALAPADPAVAVYEVVQKAIARREAAAASALENYFFRFGGSAANLLLVAEPLAEIAHLPLLLTCIAAARERGYPMPRFSASLVQTQVQLGDWDGARRTLASLALTAGNDAAQMKIWHELMQRLVDAARTTTESAPHALVELLRSRLWSIKVFRLSIDALRRAERLEAARDVIALGAGVFPTSRWLQAQAAQVSADLAARSATSSGASAETPSVFVEKIFVQRLDECLRLRQWDDAARLIREVRAARPTPSWLAARETGLHLAQVRIYGAQGNSAGIVMAAQSYLNGADDRAAALLDVARGFFRAGDQTAAVGVVKEILRRSPKYGPALRALAEWRPKPVESDGLIVDAPKS